MFSILHTKNIKAPREIVWDVITRTEEYPVWNKFVVECRSTLEANTPIVMKVRVLPRKLMKQTERILSHVPGRHLEYGMKMPFDLLASSRKHIVTSVGSNTTKYESIFMLRGLLAPVVGFLLGKQLRRGFTDMTEGIVKRAEELRGDFR